MEKIMHQGKIIEVIQREVSQNGKTKIFEFARRSPGVRLIIEDGDRILLSREFRHEIDGYDYRLPGGKVYDSLGEYNAALQAGADIDEAAKRAAIKEAGEEAGVQITNLSFFHKSICGATVVWDLFYFVTKEFRTTSQNLEEGEDIRTEWMKKEKVRSMCMDGTIREERSALVLLRYLQIEPPQK